MSSSLVAASLAGRRSALRQLLGLGAGVGAGLGVSLGAGLGATISDGARAAQGAVTGGISPRKRRGKSLDFSDPVDNLYAFGKIWGGYEQSAIGGFHGLMYMRMPGKRLVPVFGYTGTGVILCKHDPAGFLQIKSRETGYFTDLRSGDVLEHWDNPLTGERVRVYHFYNDLIAGRLTTEVPTFAYGGTGDAPTVMNDGTVFPNADGKYPFRLPFTQYGDDLMLQWDYAHEYTNPVTPEGWPTASTGARITPSEHFVLYCSLRDLENRDLTTVRMTSGFSRMSECWPWMRMGKHEQRGLTLFGRMHSHKGLANHGDVPPKVLAYIEKHAPEYLMLPEGWESKNKRVETWGAYAMDVPPETAGYDWKAKALRPEGFKGPPTGLGRSGYV